MKPRRKYPGSQMAAAACTAGCAIASAYGCANNNSPCLTTDMGNWEGGPYDDSGDDTSPGAISVTGTFNNTTCPSVNPISIGPDNGGVVSLEAVINNGTQEAAAFTASWKASFGIFSNPNGLTTTYFCTLAGLITVTFTISSPGCQPQESAGTIDCTALVGDD